MNRCARCAEKSFLVGLLLAIGAAVAASAAAAPVEKNVRKADHQAKQDGAKEKGKPAAAQSAAEKSKSATTATAKAEPAGAAKKDDTAKPAKPADEKPATYKVRKRLLKIEYLLDGTFEARQATEVALHARDWADFEVLKAVEYGAKVAQGDLLVALDTEKIDKAIADLQHEQTVGRIALQEAEVALQTLEATVPLDLASAERHAKNAVEDRDYFLKVSRPLQERVAKYLVKIAENHLAYQQEELRQLQKMYRHDDLVEETEEIVLRRTRDALETAKFNTEIQKVERDLTLQTALPRSEDSLKSSTEKELLDARKTIATLPSARRRAQLALAKLKVEAARGEERLAHLLDDRSQMTVKAPASGVVYFGRCTRGKWTSPDTLAEKLRRHGKLLSDEVFITIVQPRPLVVRTTVSEKQLPQVASGMKAMVQPAGYPDARLPAMVEHVGTVPGGSREFETLLNVSMDDAAPSVMPGMSCEVRLPAYRKADALCIPVAALGIEEGDAAKYYVALPAHGKAKEAERRSITIGRRSDKLVEVVKGLTEGEEIMAECPKDKD